MLTHQIILNIRLFSEAVATMPSADVDELVEQVDDVINGINFSQIILQKLEDEDIDTSNLYVEQP